MPCLLALVAFSAPRLVMILLVVFSSFMSRAYETTIWPLLGFLCMPYTTLAYAVAINWHHEISGSYFFITLVAALLDLGFIGSGVRNYRLR